MRPEKQSQVFDWYFLGFLALCIGLGGASRNNEMQLLVLRALALPLLAWAVIRFSADGRLGSEPLGWLAHASVAPPANQLEPLSPCTRPAGLALLGESHRGYSRTWQAWVGS